MIASLFKDMTTGDAHTSGALGGEGKRRRGAAVSPFTFKPAAKPVEKFKATSYDPNRHLGAVRLPPEPTGWRPVRSSPVEKFASVLKVDDGLGLVFGWAIVCKKDGADYYDLQDDFIPEDAMLAASADFMAGARMAKEMHAGDAAGTVLFAFPMTTDIAKAFGVETKTTGLMVAMKPAADMLAKFKSGELTGFSIGGYRITDEEAV